MNTFPPTRMLRIRASALDEVPHGETLGLCSSSMLLPLVGPLQNANRTLRGLYRSVAH